MTHVAVTQETVPRNIPGTNKWDLVDNARLASLGPRFSLKDFFEVLGLLLNLPFSVAITREFGCLSLSFSFLMG